MSGDTSRVLPTLFEQVVNLASFEFTRYLKDRKTIAIPIVSVIPLLFIAFGPEIKEESISSTFFIVLITFGLGITIISGLLFANETIVIENESKTISLWIVQPVRREIIFITRGLILTSILFIEGIIFSTTAWLLITFKANILGNINNASDFSWLFNLSEPLLKAWLWYLLLTTFYGYLFILLALITPNNFLLIGFLVGFGETFVLNTLLLPTTTSGTSLSPSLHFINILNSLINLNYNTYISLDFSLFYIILLIVIEVIVLLYLVSQREFN